MSDGKQMSLNVSIWYIYACIYNYIYNIIYVILFFFTKTNMIYCNIYTLYAILNLPLAMPEE